jgi:dCMP deaminase
MNSLDNLTDTNSMGDLRLSWDQYFMSIAVLAARRSSCKRLNVGCIIVKDNRIVTTGYNGFLRGASHTSRVRDGHEQATVHAEQNAICDAAYRGVNVSNSTAYITHYPCLVCFKLLTSCGIKTIKYLNDYNNDSYVSDLASENNVIISKLDME